ncbi:hypothetical protein [Nocardioides sp.]|uniref:hypothetical protein n=1 Tax=Nocardioides sp. TaxID=35761 RepID=UPI0026273BB3|nr:hypothetical protein [Nocardioides sp.]
MLNPTRIGVGIEAGHSTEHGVHQRYVVGLRGERGPGPSARTRPSDGVVPVLGIVVAGLVEVPRPHEPDLPVDNQELALVAHSGNLSD